MPPVAWCFRPVRPPVRACEQACRRRHFPAFQLTFIVLLSLFLVSGDIVLYSFWGGSVAEWLACRRVRVQIAAATLLGNSLRQTVHTHRASVHQATKLVAALLRVARLTVQWAWRKVMAAYRRVYDSRHMQEPYARQSSMGYLYIFYLLTHRRSTCLWQGRGRCAASANDIGIHAGWRRPPGRAELGDSGRRRAVVGPRVHRGGGGEGARRRHPSVGDRHRSVAGRTHAATRGNSHGSRGIPVERE